jgi:hypothetical protein
MAQERKNGCLENIANIPRCLQTSAECQEAKSPLGSDDLTTNKSLTFFDAYPQSSSMLWNYSKCGVYTVESEAGC